VHGLSLQTSRRWHRRPGSYSANGVAV
jgi:hypothetical protein